MNSPALAFTLALSLAFAPPPVPPPAAEPPPPPVARDEHPPIRALSFNIRYDNPADGIHAWPNRRERVIALIDSYDADIIALQEVTPAQLEFIAANLGDTHTLRGVGRNNGTNDPASGEAAPVLFRTD